MPRRRKTLLVVLALLLAAGGFAWYWQATAVDRRETGTVSGFGCQTVAISADTIQVPGFVHTYEHDNFARLLRDKVTTISTDDHFDASIRCAGPGTLWVRSEGRFCSV
ncbi:hypothetical protein LCGC14_1148530 [marine sediment metagenome]|uniref:Uncharacterized protein n=1 Tax=marine sediment metagenome TaxID=412755 RepID=A0A0F9PED2_9ZZZZ